MIVCVMLPRFELAVAAGGRTSLAAGPAALAPEAGREQFIGEVSAAAEAAGVHPGMRLGEALARCPGLALIPPDPVGVADAWEQVLVRLEGIGAAVEPGPRPGVCFFDARGLARLHGGAAGRLATGDLATAAAPARDSAGAQARGSAGAQARGSAGASARDSAGTPAHDIATAPARDPAAAPSGVATLPGASSDAPAPDIPAPPWLDGVVAVARRAIAVPARIGAGPSRFCALAGAAHARSRRVEVITGARALAAHPVALLRHRPETAPLVATLEQLGVLTIGALAALPAAAVADRFGPAGLVARALARGQDDRLRPRGAAETLQETLTLPESAAGTQLHTALELLVDRVLARRERQGRTLRAVVLAARLVEGGTWRDRTVFREALSDPQRMRLALGPRLSTLPAPAETLRLTVERFGPPHRPGAALFEDSLAVRRGRLREAVRQARAAAGPDAALRVLTIDPDSRVPERRAVLTPFE